MPRIVLRVNVSREDEVPLHADVGEELSAYRCQARSRERRAATCKCGRARRCGKFNLSVPTHRPIRVRPPEGIAGLPMELLSVICGCTPRPWQRGGCERQPHLRLSEISRNSADGINAAIHNNLARAAKTIRGLE
ncbi:MAG: hypothetical protein QOH91_973 [Mycobacterium sp.]|nr:hypothetical protein [Mycobacterium sp.]